MRLREGGYVQSLILWALITRLLQKDYSSVDPEDHRGIRETCQYEKRQTTAYNWYRRWQNLYIWQLSPWCLWAWWADSPTGDPRFIHPVWKPNLYRLWYRHPRCCPQAYSPRGFLWTLSPDSWEDGTSGCDRGDDGSSRCLRAHNQVRVLWHQHWPNLRSSWCSFRTSHAASQRHKLVEGFGGKRP